MYEGPLLTNVKSVKTSILVLKVIQGHCFRCQSKAMYDFLLVINCNLGPIPKEDSSVPIGLEYITQWFRLSQWLIRARPVQCALQELQLVAGVGIPMMALRGKFELACRLFYQLVVCTSS